MRANKSHTGINKGNGKGETQTPQGRLPWAPRQGEEGFPGEDFPSGMGIAAEGGNEGPGTECAFQRGLPSTASYLPQLPNNPCVCVRTLMRTRTHMHPLSLIDR